MSKLLVVYNTCGLKGVDNTWYYIPSIESILNQRFNGEFDVVISDCYSSHIIRNSLRRHFGKKVFYSFVYDLLPVNMTFNHTVKELNSLKGPYDAFLYIDSGVSFTRNDDIQKLWDTYKSGPYAMVASKTNTDSGSENWFNASQEGIPSIIPLGKAVNLHCQIFDSELLKAYNGLMPDILASHCTESLFTFMCAGIKKKWALCHDVTVNHAVSLDGASWGFNPQGTTTTKMGIETWEHLVKWAPRTMREIITDPLARQCGLGYEEFRGVLMHDSNKYTEDGYALDDSLLNFIRDNLFLSRKDFNYNKVVHEILGEI